MSSEKSSKDERERLAQAQAVDIISECYEKKFAGNASNMARWLPSSTNNVTKWLSGRRVPAWVIVRVFGQYADIRNKYLAESKSEIKSVNPYREKLLGRIDNLLADPAMFEHLDVQVKICEDAQRQRMSKVEREQIVQEVIDSGTMPIALKERVVQLVKTYGYDTERTPTVHDPAGDPGPLLPAKNPSAVSRPALPHSSRKTPHRKR